MDKKQLKLDVALANSTEDVSTLVSLAKHESDDVRWAVASNPHTPEEILHLLTSDSERYIRMGARERLGLSEFSEIQQPTYDHIFLSTLENNPNLRIEKIHGAIFGSSSKIAWGLSRQSERLDNAAELALLSLRQQADEIGANAVIGISLSANSSQGSSAAFMGSSEGIIAIGTAVTIKA